MTDTPGSIAYPIEVQEAPSETTKASILIVEDEAGPREALKMILRPFFNLYAVDNTEVAMQILRAQKIDLVTLDLKLPRRQGMDLLQEIKREQEDVEVIIITGYGSLQSAMEGIRYGAAAYLLKPFNVTELIEVINQTLDKKRRFDSLRNSPTTFSFSRRLKRRDLSRAIRPYGSSCLSWPRVT